MDKSHLLDASSIKPIAVGFGSCLATDRITVDGAKIGYMYRENPDDDVDSGWRFFAGDETDEYVNDAANLALYDVNTIANYDPEITPFLESEFETAFARIDGSFEEIPWEGPQD